MDVTLTPRQRAALTARRNLTAFCYAAYPPYRHAPHLALIDAALMDVERYLATGGREGIGKLMIEAPPRHGKSVKVARLLPPWLMGRNPDWRVIIASHTASLSESHSRAVRNTIKSPSYRSIFPRTQLSEDSQARDAWDLADPAQGGLLAVGTGGAVVGRGGNILLADDLFASREQYESKTARDKLYSWFSDEFSTRAAPVSATIMIGSRWGLDDVQGRLLLQEADRWKVIRLPALAEPTEDDPDPLGREPGAALWPEQYSRDYLLDMRQRLGDYSFSALYQQSPVSASGGVFRRDKLSVIDHEPADIKTRVRFWDLALSAKTSADYTVGCLMGETKDKRQIVLDVARFQENWGDLTKRIAAVARADGPTVRIGIETAFFHSQAVTELLRRPDMHGYSVQAIAPTVDKVTRALPFAARVDAQMVSVLNRVWTQDYISELCSFPNGGKHDDQVDASSGAYLMLGRQPIIATTRRWA